MVKVGKYTIHGFYGNGTPGTRPLHENTLFGHVPGKAFPNGIREFMVCERDFFLQVSR